MSKGTRKRTSSDDVLTIGINLGDRCNITAFLMLRMTSLNRDVSA